jgi:hypothetical protein
VTKTTTGYKVSPPIELLDHVGLAVGGALLMLSLDDDGVVQHVDVQLRGSGT